MTLTDVMGKSGGTTLIRRPLLNGKGKFLVLRIEDGSFYYETANRDKEDLTPYAITTYDLCAKDWELERKEWVSK